MMSSEHDTFLREVAQSRSAFTTYNRYYHPDCPVRRLLGQSAVTALAMHDEFGGSILRETVQLPTGDNADHFSNVIDGETVDPTRGQYDFYPERFGHVVFVGDLEEVDRASFTPGTGNAVLYDVFLETRLSNRD